MENFWKTVSKWAQYLIGQDPEVQSVIHLNEDVEYLRLMTEFPPEEVVRLQKKFMLFTNQSSRMTLEQFLSIEAIERNPLKRRIATVFGFIQDTDTLKVTDFVQAMAQFNSPGKRGEKLQLMFRLHDGDGDGYINQDDMIEYLQLVTADTMNEDDIQESVGYMFREFDRNVRKRGIGLSEFNLVVGPTDFHTKLYISI
jgi:Ca2+-binding EF-hand superfamily protein